MLNDLGYASDCSGSTTATTRRARAGDPSPSRSSTERLSLAMPGLRWLSLGEMTREESSCLVMGRSGNAAKFLPTGHQLGAFRQLKG